jgi:hypothetical protein
MTRGGGLRPGPARKTSAWRGGAFAVGAVLMLWALALITDGAISLIGLRGSILGLLVGLALSVPYGRAWLAGRAPEARPPGDVLVPAAEVHPEGGATYIVLAEGRRRPGVRAKELTPGWYLLYSVFWRAPTYLGDYALSGIWTAVAAATGRESAPRRPDDVEPDLPEPSRIEF